MQPTWQNNIQPHITPRTVIIGYTQNDIHRTIKTHFGVSLDDKQVILFSEAIRAQELENTQSQLDDAVCDIAKQLGMIEKAENDLGEKVSLGEWNEKKLRAHEVKQYCKENDIQGFIEDITMIHTSEWKCPLCRNTNKTEDSWPQKGETIECKNCTCSVEVSKTPE